MGASLCQKRAQAPERPELFSPTPMPMQQRKENRREVRSKEIEKDKVQTLYVRTPPRVDSR